MIEPSLIDGADRGLVRLAAQIDAAQFGADMPAQRDDFEPRFCHYVHWRFLRLIGAQPSYWSRRNQSNRRACAQPAISASAPAWLSPEYPLASHRFVRSWSAIPRR